MARRTADGCQGSGDSSSSSLMHTVSMVWVMAQLALSRKLKALSKLPAPCLLQSWHDILRMTILVSANPQRFSCEAAKLSLMSYR